ncbi:MAG: diguanylate cyclase [Gammaproteobacteria bacterium]|nr:diguanylate cyclase [Gammaproteobacteria bacterium]
MNGRRKLNLIAVVFLTLLFVVCISLVLLYQSAYRQYQNNLVNVVRSNANLIRAVQRFDAVESQDVMPGGASAATLSQLIDAQNSYQGFGKTDELLLVVAAPDGGGFLNRQRFGAQQQFIPLPENPKLAMPARRAIAENSGVMEGLDYRGEPVLAAYEWVDGLNVGLVAKIDLEEIREPFEAEAMKLVGIAMVLSIFVSVYIYRVGQDFEQRLANTAEKFRLLLESSADGIFGVDLNGSCTFANPACATMFGCGDSHQLLGMNMQQFFQYEENEYYYRLLRTDGSSVPVEYTERPLKNNGRCLGAVVRFFDISERLEAERDVRFRATHDAGTGLINRTEFERRLKEVLKSHGENNHCLLYLDLDHFKTVNDTAGHAAGDQLLKNACELIQGRLRKRDIFARTGGDEFAIILENCSLQDAACIADGIVNAVAGYEFEWEGKKFQVGVSIGVQKMLARLTLEQLMASADAACYEAKRHGRSRIWIAEQSPEKLKKTG